MKKSQLRKIIRNIIKEQMMPNMAGMNPMQSNKVTTMHTMQGQKTPMPLRKTKVPVEKIPMQPPGKMDPRRTQMSSPSIMNKARQMITMMDSNDLNQLMEKYSALYNSNPELASNGCPNPMSVMSEQIAPIDKSDLGLGNTTYSMAKHPLVWIAIGACFLLWDNSPEDDDVIDD